MERVEAVHQIVQYITQIVITLKRICGGPRKTPVRIHGPKNIVSVALLEVIVNSLLNVLNMAWYLKETYSTLQHLTKQSKHEKRISLLKVPWMRGNTVTHDVGSISRLSCFLENTMYYPR